MVSDPLGERRNTGDNTPAVVHVEMVPGDAVTITLAAKGGGSENKARFAVLRPSASVADWVVETVETLGAGWCPPGLLGVGVGGSAERAMQLAKGALLGPIDMGELIRRGPRTRAEELRIEIYERINALSIGAQGLGGLTTVVDVKIASFPSHAASLPVDLRGRAIHYVGPVDAIEGEAVGPAGPTTSTRMDPFVNTLLAETGLLVMIGKAERGPAATAAIARHGAAYLIAVGGAAYLVSKAIRSVRVLAFPDLGMEAIHEFEVVDMPVTVAVDSTGESVHRTGPPRWRRPVIRHVPKRDGPKRDGPKRDGPKRDAPTRETA